MQDRIWQDAVPPPDDPPTLDEFRLNVQWLCARLCELDEWAGAGTAEQRAEKEAALRAHWERLPRMNQEVERLVGAIIPVPPCIGPPTYYPPVARWLQVPDADVDWNRDADGKNPCRT